MILDRNSDVPLFGQLKNILIRQIEEGEYSPGDMLPSEVELIEKYSVSRTTVRKVAQALVQEGYAYTVHGKGTFVIESGLTQYLNNLTSFSHSVSKRGMLPDRQILSLDLVNPDKHSAAKLRIPPSGMVIKLERLLSADGEPVSIGKTFISLANIAPYQDKFNLDTLNEQGLYSLLESIGINLTGGEQVVSAAAADEMQARLLKVDVGSPLLFSERLSFMEGNVPIEYTEMWSRADKTRWRVVLGPYDSNSK